MAINNSTNYKTTQYNVLTGGATNLLNNVVPSGTSGVPLISQGASSQPVFGTTVVAGGGTGDTSFTIYAPICGGTTSQGVLQSASSGISNSGYILTSTGASSLPTWQANSAITTIDGDTGSVTGSTITIFANTSQTLCGSTVTFVGSGSTLSLRVTDDSFNTVIGLFGGSLVPLAGNFNTALGYAVLFSIVSGQSNCAIGTRSLTSITTGSNNSALGCGIQAGGGALGKLLTGSNNIAIGSGAGTSYTSSESSNILIGNIGVVSESNVIRIGTQGSSAAQQNQCFIAGITGVSVSNQTIVTLDSSAGQLGEVSTVPVANGGTGAATLTGVLIGNGTSAVTGNAVTQNDVLVGGASNAITSITNGTTGQIFQATTSSNPGWTTATYPATTTINDILYSSSNNVIGQITASNNGVLISGTGGIPSWLAAGTTGQVLVATTSNPASWGILSSIAVTSIAGTTNQISASASTGAVTLSLVGPYTPASYTAFAVLCGGTTSTGSLQSVSGVGTSGMVLTSNGASLLPTWKTAAGNVNGPGSSTDTAVARWNGTTGILLENSGVLIDGSNNVTGVNSLVAGPSAAFNASTLTVSSTGAYNTSIYGTQTATSSNLQAGLTLHSTFDPTSGASTGCYSLYNEPIFIAPSGQTIAAAYGLYTYLTVSSNVGTITNAAGLYVDTGSAGGGGASVITNAYGAYLTTPTAGSSSVALYADNVCLGGAAISINNGSVLNVKSTGSWNTTFQGTQTAQTSNFQIGIHVATAFSPTNSVSSGSFGIYNFPAFVAASTKTIAEATAMYIANTVSQNIGTITNLYGIHVDTGTVGGGGASVITNSYGAYIKTPSAGSNTLALYTDNVTIGGGVVNINNNAVLNVIATGAYGTSFGGTQTAQSGNYQLGINIGCIFAPTNSLSNGAFGVYNFPDFIAASTKTITEATALYLANTVSSNVGTITNLYGLHIDTGTAGGGGGSVITNSYGAFMKAPSATGVTCTIALYADNICVGSGATNVTPPTGGMVVSGSVFIGSSTQGTIAGSLYVGSTVSTSYTTYGALGNGATPAVHISGSSGSVGVAISANGRIVSNSEVDATSDRRKKENISEITSERAMQFVKGVTPVSFNRKDSGEFSHGYIAQDVVKNFGAIYNILPTTDHIEQTIDDDGFVSPADHIFTLSYSQAIPLLHKVILNLLERIEKLENQLKN